MPSVSFVHRLIDATRGGVVSVEGLRGLAAEVRHLKGKDAEHAARLLDLVRYDRELDPQELKEAQRLLGKLGATATELHVLRPVAACNLRIDKIDLELDLKQKPIDGRAVYHLGKAAPAKAVLEANPDLIKVREVRAGNRLVPFEQVKGRLVFDGDGAKTVTVAYDLVPQTKVGSTGLTSRAGELVTVTWPERVCDLFPSDTRPGLAITATVTLHSHKQAVLQGVGSLVESRPGFAKFALTTAAPPHAIGFYAAERGERLRRAGNPTAYVSRRASPAIDGQRRRLLDVAQSTHRYLEAWFGPSPFGPVEAILEVPSALGGMENARSILVARGSARQVYEGARTVAHEIVHHWFGNAVRPKSFSDLWLSEGFTTYLTMRAEGARRGGEAYRRMLQGSLDSACEGVSARARSKSHYPLRPESDVVPNMPLWDDVVYELGAFVLIFMEARLGRERFDGLLAAWFDHAKHAAVSTKEFFAFARARTGLSFADLEKTFVDTLPARAELRARGREAIAAVAPT